MTMPPVDESVRLLDIYTKQIQLGTQIAVMDEKLKVITDHEVRLRVLERFRYTLMGVASAVGVVSAWITNLILSRHP